MHLPVKLVWSALLVMLVVSCQTPPSSRPVGLSVKASSPLTALDVALGAPVSAVRSRCEERGGTFAIAGDEGTCSGARAEWAPTGESQVWFQGEALAAQTSFGPFESFDMADARADRLVALPWAKPEEDMRTYVCAALPPETRVSYAREPTCRYSRYFRDGDRVVHVLVQPLGAALWMTVLDEQWASAPGPAIMNAPYPTELGPFMVGGSVSETSNACTAGGGGYTRLTPEAALCERVDAPSLKLRNATVWLSYCKGGLCGANFVIETVTAGEAIRAFVPTRNALVRAFGPPANRNLATCAYASPSRLSAALKFGHCEPGSDWKANNGVIVVDAGPADHQKGYPPDRYRVKVTFDTPMHVEEFNNTPG